MEEEQPTRRHGAASSTALARSLRDAREGVPGAREALLAGSAPLVLGWCRRLGGPYVDPDDAAQDVILVIMRRFDQVRDPDAWTSWLFGVTRRVLARHRRRAWLRRWLPGAPLPDPPDPGRSPHDRAAGAQLARALEEAIATLPTHQREVVVLCDVEERPDSEVAALLGVPKGTVKSRLRRGRATLRDHLSARGLAAHVHWLEEA